MNRLLVIAAIVMPHPELAPGKLHDNGYVS
jgi:hypothetical protein